MKIKALFAGLLLIPLLSGCYNFDSLNEDLYNPAYHGGGDIKDSTGTGKYADININYSLSTEDVQSLKDGLSNVSTLFASLTYDGVYNDYQRTTNLTHDTYCGYICNNKPDFNYNSPNYQYTDGWSNYRWNHFYNDRTVREYSQLIKTFKFVDYKKYKNAFYITRIYWAFLASMQTDTYGDIPLSDYVQGKTPTCNVAYNTQEKAYDMIFRLLEQAVDSIEPGTSDFSFGENDKCYKGDETKWLRFANTLRLRLALRISNVDPTRAKTEGEAAMSNKWGLMQSDADNMRTVPRHAPVALGGIDAGGDENVLAMCSFAYNGDCVMSKDLEDAYRNQSTGGATYQVIDPKTGPVNKIIDPRCVISWWRPTPMEKLKINKEYLTNDFTGCEIGNLDVKHTESVANYSVTRTDIQNSKVLDPKKWFGYSRESVWLGYAESRFLLAEASLRGWTGASETPEAYFQEGIRASMKYYQISSAETENYISGLKIYASDDANPFKGTNREAMLEQIITQKWLAVFPNGNEGWAEFRRTDYPRLRNNLHNISSDVPQGKFIKRILYPYSEKDNPNKPTTTDTQATRLWWDVADTNNSTGVRNTPNNFR